MHEVLFFAIRVLEGAFLAGMIGSAIVVIWVAVEDSREIGSESPKSSR